MKESARKLNPNNEIDNIKLTHARVRLALSPKVILGRVFAAFVGQRFGSIRFTFVPKGGRSPVGIESLEFELTRNQAWFLAEWMTKQSIRRGPRPEQNKEAGLDRSAKKKNRP